MANTLDLFSAGVKVVDLADASGNYHLKYGTWSPQRAELAVSDFGNDDPYEVVEESMELHITGSTADDITEAIDNMGEVINRARQWSSWELTTSATLVKFRYKPTNSAIPAPLEAIVLGPPERQKAVTLPANFDALRDGLSVDKVQLKFRRRGAFYGATDSDADTPTDQGDVAQVIFANNLPHLSPFTLTITGFDSPGGLPSHYILIGKLAGGLGDIMTIEGEDGSIHSSVNEAANLASGGLVQRITAPGTPPATSEVWTGILGPSHEIVGIYATMRVNSSARTWKVRAKTETDAGTVNSQTEWIVLDGAVSDEPQPVFLGYVFSAAKLHQTLTMEFQADGGTNPTLDIDRIWMIGLDDRVCRSLTILSDESVVSGVTTLAINPRQLTALEPIVTADTIGGDTHYIGWRGDAFLGCMGTALAAVAIITEPALGFWKLSDGSAAVDLTYTFQRQRAYPNPR